MAEKIRNTVTYKRECYQDSTVAKYRDEFDLNYDIWKEALQRFKEEEHNPQRRETRLLSTNDQ